MEGWDKSVSDANCTYTQRMHNLCCDNCHSHVANALDRMEYRGFKAWNMVILALWIFLFGRFTTLSRTFMALVPSAMIWAGLIWFLA